MDANGILQVSAHDKGTGRTESITVTGDDSRLSTEEIQRMVKDAEDFYEQDKAALERVTARNELESYAFGLRNQVNDPEGFGGKIDEDDREAVS